VWRVRRQASPRPVADIDAHWLVIEERGRPAVRVTDLQHTLRVPLACDTLDKAEVDRALPLVPSRWLVRGLFQPDERFVFVGYSIERYPEEAG